MKPNSDNEWSNAYQSQRFWINTLQPSQVVELALKNHTFPLHFRVLDIGCGNGRNAIYAASLGGLVQAIDIADLHFLPTVETQLRNKITFSQQSALDFTIEPESYSLIIATRLIQYISFAEVRLLFRKINQGLTPKGLAAISYNAAGGIHTKPDIKVTTHQHSIKQIEQELDAAGLKIVSLNEGAKVSQHVPFKLPMESYDILVQKK